MEFIKKHFTLITLLFFGLLVFFYSYWTNMYRPGVQSDLGWYKTWADQKRYYEQANAIAHLQLSKENFYYPLIYPLLGAFFIQIMPRDPFLLINLTLFLITIALTYLLIKRVFDKQKAIFAVLLLLSTHRFVYDFVTPWNTNLTTPLFLALFFINYLSQFSIKNLILMTLLTVVTFLSRYSDIVFFLPLLVAFVFKERLRSLKHRIKKIALIGVILAIAVTLLAGIHLATSGSIIGPYVKRLTHHFIIQITPLTLFEKTIGFFFNSFIFHRQIEFFSTPVFIAFPILLFLIVNILLLLRSFNNTSYHLQVIHLSVFVSFLLWYFTYIPYGAIAPYTLKNLSLHYIKPWYPISIFYLMVLIKNVFIKQQIDAKVLKLFFIGFFALCIIPFTIQKFQPKLISKIHWTIKTSVNQEIARKLIDDKFTSFWSTKKPRKNGDSITIDMKNSYLVSRLQLIDRIPNAATNFDTLLSDDNRIWKKLARNYTYNVRREYGWDVVGYMQKARYIKLVLNEESPTDPWDIGEIYVFGYSLFFLQ